ncbi:hypothetical protein VB005_05319 [Metarhizium brunneum]
MGTVYWTAVTVAMRQRCQPIASLFAPMDDGFTLHRPVAGSSIDRAEWELVVRGSWLAAALGTPSIPHPSGSVEP